MLSQAARRRFACAAPTGSQRSSSSSSSSTLWCAQAAGSGITSTVPPRMLAICSYKVGTVGTVSPSRSGRRMCRMVFIVSNPVMAAFRPVLVDPCGVSRPSRADLCCVLPREGTGGVLHRDPERMRNVDVGTVVRRVGSIRLPGAVGIRMAMSSSHCPSGESSSETARSSRRPRRASTPRAAMIGSVIRAPMS